MIEINSDYYFTAASWFPENVRVKSHSTLSAPPPFKCLRNICMAPKREKGRRVDAFVQSTDKNLMVPVGGSIIAGKANLIY